MDPYTLPHPTFSLRRKGSNQYKKETDDDIWTWLLDNAYIHGTFQCRIPTENLSGIIHTANGYKRINRRGRKILAHRFSYCYSRNIQGGINGDISHLCHNNGCINPGHLIEEDHATNISRNGCPGYIYIAHLREYYKLCVHEVPCKIVTDVTSGPIYNHPISYQLE